MFNQLVGVLTDEPKGLVHTLIAKHADIESSSKGKDASAVIAKLKQLKQADDDSKVVRVFDMPSGGGFEACRRPGG